MGLLSNINEDTKHFPVELQLSPFTAHKPQEHRNKEELWVMGTTAAL